MAPSPLTMHDPPHPGELVREECLRALGLSVSAAAAGLGVSRKTLSELINGHAGISPTMAIRLAKAFGGSAEAWLRMQVEYDLWHARKREAAIAVTRFVPKPGPTRRAAA